MAGNTRRDWRQFSLRTLLWLMLLIAVGLTAHRRGYDAGHTVGFDAGVNEGMNRRKEVGEPYAKIYSLAELFKAADSAEASIAEHDDFIRDLRAKVLPSTWMEMGGQAAARILDDGQKLIVSHDQDGQERVAEYLAKRRRIIPKVSTSMK